MEVRIKLRPGTDPNEPVLDAVVLKDCERSLSRVRVVTRHPIWHGAELEKRHFRMTNERVAKEQTCPR